MIQFGEIVFKTVNNDDYEALTIDQKREFQETYRMFAIQHLIKDGVWVVIPRYNDTVGVIPSDSDFVGYI